MTETNEITLDRLRALSIKDRLVRDWFLAFNAPVRASLRRAP